MFCIISFVVLSILGIFSASNRVLAREAFECVGRRVTLRPCNTGFDEKIKAKILGVVITRSEAAAVFLNKYFEALAWVFFVLMLASSVMFVRGLFLFYVTGSCNGLNDSSFCVFDPTGQNTKTSGNTGCKVSPNAVHPIGLTLEGVDLSNWPVKNPQGKDTIVFIGCYACDYTRQVYPDIRALVDQYNVRLVFGEYPTVESSDYLARVSACVYQQAPDKLWPLNDLLFAQDKAVLEDPRNTEMLLSGLGLNVGAINACVQDPATETSVKARLKEIEKTNFTGTPTVFVNGGEGMIGPKPYRVYAIQLRGLFYWAQ